MGSRRALLPRRIYRLAKRCCLFQCLGRFCGTASWTYASSRRICGTCRTFFLLDRTLRLVCVTFGCCDLLALWFTFGLRFLLFGFAGGSAAAHRSPGLLLQDVDLLAVLDTCDINLLSAWLPSEGYSHRTATAAQQSRTAQRLHRAVRFTVPIWFRCCWFSGRFCRFARRLYLRVLPAYFFSAPLYRRLRRNITPPGFFRLLGCLFHRLHAEQLGRLLVAWYTGVRSFPAADALPVWFCLRWRLLSL